MKNLLGDDLFPNSLQILSAPYKLINFLFQCRRGYYNNIKFHRVISVSMNLAISSLQKSV